MNLSRLLAHSLPLAAKTIFIKPAAVWLRLGVLGFALVIAIWLPTTSFRVKLAGLMLDVAGICFVAENLLQVRAQFNKPPFWSSFLAWLREIRGAFSPPRNATLNATLGAMTVSAAAVQMQVTRANPTVEQRLEDLEREFKEHKTVVSERVTDLAHRTTTLEARVDKEAADMRASQNQTSERLEKFATADLHVAAIGLFYVLLGVAFGNWSDEISCLTRTGSPPWEQGCAR